MEFITPKKLSELLKIISTLSRKNSKIYFAAGTTDLYVQIKDGAIKEPSVFIDISNLSELKKISLVGKDLHIGASATFTEIIKNPQVNKNAPLLVAAAKEIGSPLIRNRATIGGNIANSSPAGDSIPALVSLGAIAVLRYAKSTRKIPVEKLFTGPKKNILKNGELISEIIIPKNDFNFSRFLKLGSRKALAISKVSLAVAGKITNAKTFSEVKISAGAVGPTVIRCLNTEKFLTSSGNLTSPATINKAKEIISAEVLPIDDFRSTADYRRQTAAALLKEILLELPS